MSDHEAQQLPHVNPIEEAPAMPYKAALLEAARIQEALKRTPTTLSAPGLQTKAWQSMSDQELQEFVVRNPTIIRDLTDQQQQEIEARLLHAHRVESSSTVKPQGQEPENPVASQAVNIAAKFIASEIPPIAGKSEAPAKNWTAMSVEDLRVLIDNDPDFIKNLNPNEQDLLEALLLHMHRVKK